MRTPRIWLARLLNVYGWFPWTANTAASIRRHLKLRAHAEDGYCPHDWHGYYDDVGGSG